MKFLSIFKRDNADTQAGRGSEDRPQDAPKPDEKWVRLRAPEREQDRVLSTEAQAWMRNLPPRVRPIKLCKLHPRIINRFALFWRDPVQMADLFDELLTDRRGDRRGFAPPVVAELEQLRDFSAQRGASAPQYQRDAQAQPRPDPKK